MQINSSQNISSSPITPMPPFTSDATLADIASHSPEPKEWIVEEKPQSLAPEKKETHGIAVSSFFETGVSLEPLTVEIELMRGLPDIKILGLPDLVIRESLMRIKSAIKAQGFYLPTNQMVLVQLSPPHIRKRGTGLALPIAAGILWATGQVPYPKVLPALYGDLTLSGEVVAPEDVDEIQESDCQSGLVTACVESPLSVQPSYQIRKLKELLNPQSCRIEVGSPFPKIRPPIEQHIKLSTENYHLASVVAGGEHPTLFVGTPGVGKSTITQLIARSLYEPTNREFHQSRSIWRRMGKDLSWRPITAPHHTSTAIAFIGGGNPPRPGVLTLSHGGTLIMDEFLEFHPNIQESLREPLEQGSVTVARVQGVRDFPARLLLLATTNLCPCGEFQPQPQHRCRCNVRQVQNYLARLSGPVTDRFHILSFLSSSKEDMISAQRVQEKVKVMREFAETSRSQTSPNAYLQEDDILNTLNPKLKTQLPETLQNSSQRRKLSLLRVARSFADLHKSHKIESMHLKRAAELTVFGHSRLLFDVHRYI